MGAPLWVAVRKPGQGLLLRNEHDRVVATRAGKSTGGGLTAHVVVLLGNWAVRVQVSRRLLVFPVVGGKVLPHCLCKPVRGQTRAWLAGTERTWLL